jgi:hypothetical protein
MRPSSIFWLATATLLSTLTMGCLPASQGAFYPRLYPSSPSVVQDSEVANPLFHKAAVKTVSFRKSRRHKTA